MQAIRTHRAVRRFRPDAISETDLRAILDAGRLSGSSKNSQRWAFIAVRDGDTLQRLAAVGDYAGHLAGATAAVALVTPTCSARSTSRASPVAAIRSLISST